MYYLINLKAKQINSKHDTLGAAEAAAAMVDWDFHIVKPSEFEACTLTDLANFYNNIPGIASPVTRFSSKAAAIERINAHIAFPEAGKKVRKPRKPREPGAGVGRKATWEAVELTAAGKGDDARFHRDNPRFKVYELIKKHGKLDREELIKLAEKELGITRSQTFGCVSKLTIRKLVKLH